MRILYCQIYFILCLCNVVLVFAYFNYNNNDNHNAVYCIHISAICKRNIHFVKLEPCSFIGILKDWTLKHFGHLCFLIGRWTGSVAHWLLQIIHSLSSVVEHAIDHVAACGDLTLLPLSYCNKQIINPLDPSRFSKKFPSSPDHSVKMGGNGFRMFFNFNIFSLHFLTLQVMFYGKIIELPTRWW